MSFTSIYKKILSVHLYHHYFLDDGVTLFDTNPSIKTAQLSKYNFKDFMEIVPSHQTQKKLEGHKIAVKTNTSGIDLWMKAEETAPNSGVYQPFIGISPTEKLTFLLKVKDGLFENYSTVSATPQVPYFFSNKKPITEPGSFRYIDVETTTHGIEDFTMEPATWENLKKELNTAERQGLFGILQLEMEGDDTTGLDGNARNIINTDGSLQEPCPTYKIQIKNRSTIWNYINPVANTLVHSTDPTELPLVKQGIIGYTFNSEERPSAKPYRIIFEKDSGGNIIKTISEIYIN